MSAQVSPVVTDSTPLPLTASQTVGPYFSIGMDWPGANRLAADSGDAIRVFGQVLDGDGAGVPDAVLDLWQADAAGHYHPRPRGEFKPLGRCPTDVHGAYEFFTVRPGAVVDRGGRQAPHLNLCIFARGLLRHLYTRIYFDDAPDDNAGDPVLSAVPAERRRTLVAQTCADGFEFVIRLQGPDETVFFDV